MLHSLTMLSNRYATLIAGLLSGLIFAPTFLIPAVFALSLLCFQVYKSMSWRHAAIYGFIFGFGHFLTGLYWISIGVSVYIEEFWWALPFALFGLPLVLSCFIAASCYICWFIRNSKYYHFVFCVVWVFFEWLRSWIFTGLPWNLLGYALSFSEILIQVTSIVSIYGLSFVVIYIATSLHHLLVKQRCDFVIALTTAGLILVIIIVHGVFRLHNNPVKFLNIQVRLVQPSIPQLAKWDLTQFWQHLDLHLSLSQAPGNPDLIIWSEASLVVPYTHPSIKYKLLEMLNNTGAILLAGGITDNGKQDDAVQIYTALYALKADGEQLFEYHKSHLVPFGEYMPLKHIIPLKKLTPGFIDYTEGTANIVKLDKFNLVIRPLICYESIFPNEARVSNSIADVIINVTNDGWYGNSSGPHQHFYISRMRAIENGMPMIRVANNGISVIIDPLGRIIKKLNLNQIGFVDGFIPEKLATPTLYSLFGDSTTLIIVFLVLIMQFMIKSLFGYHAIRYCKA